MLLPLLLLLFLFWLNFLLSSSVVLVMNQHVALNGTFCITNTKIHFYKNLLYGQRIAWYKKSRSSHRRCSVATRVLKYFANFTVKHLYCNIFLSLQHFYWKETSCVSCEIWRFPVKKVFSCEICEILRNSYFEKHPRTTASRKLHDSALTLIWISLYLFFNKKLRRCLRTLNTL